MLTKDTQYNKLKKIIKPPMAPAEPKKTVLPASQQYKQKTLEDKYGPDYVDKVDYLNTSKNTGLNNAARGSVIGGIMSQAADQGYIPDILDSDLTGWQKAWRAIKFPATKLMSAFMAFPRGEGAFYEKGVEQGNTQIFDFRKQEQAREELSKSDNIKDLIHPKYIGGKEIETDYKDLGTDVKKIEEQFKAFGEGFINKKGSQYQDYSWSKAIKESEVFTDYHVLDQKFEWATNTNDWIYGTNWIQKTGNMLLGTPADIIGLALDITGDPLSYLTGGLPKGSRTGVTITEDILDSTGKVFKKAGTELGVTKKAKELIKKITVINYSEVQKGLVNATTTGQDLSVSFIKRWFPQFASTAIDGVKNPKNASYLKKAFEKMGKVMQEDLSSIISSTKELDTKAITKMLIESTPEAITAMVERQSTIETIINAAKMLEPWEAATYIEKGGLKLAGMEIATGDQLVGITRRMMKVLDRVPVAKEFVDMIWTGRRIPKDMLLVKNFIDSGMRNQTTKLTEKMMQVYKTIADRNGKLDPTVHDVVNEVMQSKKSLGIYKSIPQEKMTEEIYRAMLNLTKNIDNSLARLNPKQMEMATQFMDLYKRELVPAFQALDDQWGIVYNKLKDYVPTRISSMGSGGKLGIEEIKNEINKILGLDDAASVLGKDTVGQGVKDFLGKQKATYQKHVESDWLKAKKEISQFGGKMADLQEATLKRIWEAEQRIGRAKRIELSKQFGKLGKFTEEVGDKLEDIKQAFTEGKSNLSWKEKNATGEWLSGVYEEVKGIPELKGWSFPKEIARVLKSQELLFGTSKSLETTIKGWDALLLFWKRNALATPGYHVRNFLSDTYSGLMEWGMEFLNLKYWKDAQAIEAASKYKWARDTKLLTIPGMTAGEKADILAEIGVRNTTQSFVEAGTKGAMSSIGKQLSVNEWSTRFGNVRENMGRIVGSLIEERAGSSPLIISAQVKKVFFDYTDVPQFTQKWLKKFYNPFVTWSIKNIPRQVELLLTRGGKMASIAKVKNYFENKAEMPENWSEIKPEWMEEAGVWDVGLEDAEGNPIGLTPDFPWKDLLVSNPVDTLGILGNPFIKMIVEQIFQKSEFTMAPIDMEGWIKGPATLIPLKVFSPGILMGMSAGQITKNKSTGDIMIKGRLNHILESMVPMFRSLARIFPQDPDLKAKLQAISTGFGVKAYKTDLKQAETNVWNKLTENIRKSIENKQLTELPDGQSFMKMTDMKVSARQKIKDIVWEKFWENETVANRKKQIDSEYASGILTPAEAKKQANELLKEYKDMIKQMGISTMELNELKSLFNRYGIKMNLEELGQIKARLDAEKEAAEKAKAEKEFETLKRDGISE